MKIKLFISLLVLVSGQFAFSQDRAGNGGDAIICHDSVTGKSSVEVKDYWEYSQMINNLKIDLGPGKTYTEKVEYALNRLKKIDPVRADKLIERFNDTTFISFVSRGQIPEVNDSPSFLKVDNDKYCNEVQVAFQILNPKQFQSKVLIDKSIFSQFDEVNKAGLILHELIYEQDIKHNNAKDSDIIRWFNYIISTDITKIFNDLKNGKSEKYAELISDRKIDYFGYDSTPNLRPSESRTTAPTQKKEEEKNIPLLLPSNFSIVSSEVNQNGRNTTVESMLIDIEDDLFELNKMKFTINQKENVLYELGSESQKITGDFSLHFNDQKWQVSSISTNKGREFDLKLEEKSVNVLNLNISGDLSYSMNSFGQSLRGLTSFALNDVQLGCSTSCKVSWSDDTLPTFEGEFNFNNYKLNFLGAKAKKISFSLGSPLEYKVKTAKASRSQFIQRAELSEEGLMAFIVIKKNDSEIELMNSKFTFPKCEANSCSYKMNLKDLSFKKI